MTIEKRTLQDTDLGAAELMLAALDKDGQCTSRPLSVGSICLFLQATFPRALYVIVTPEPPPPPDDWLHR